MPDRGLYKLEHRIDICPADVVVEAFSQLVGVARRFFRPGALFLKDG